MAGVLAITVYYIYRNLRAVMMQHYLVRSIGTLGSDPVPGTHLDAPTYQCLQNSILDHEDTSTGLRRFSLRLPFEVL